MSDWNDSPVRAILSSSDIVEVATLSPTGRPFVTPLWFVVDGPAVYITSGPGSRAGRNIEHHDQVALLFLADSRPGARQALRVRGAATCHSGPLPWRVLWRVILKYRLSPRALVAELESIRMWSLRRRYYAQAAGGAGYIRVVPSNAEILEVS